MLKKKEYEKRAITRNLYLTIDEYNLLKQELDRTGESLNAYVRRMVIVPLIMKKR